MKNLINNKKATHSEQLKFDFNTVSKPTVETNNKSIGMVINLHERTKQIITAQILKNTKCF